MGIKFYDSNGKYWGEYDEARNLFIPSTDCESCKHYNPNHEAIACERCLDGKYSRYEPQKKRSE